MEQLLVVILIRLRHQLIRIEENWEGEQEILPKNFGFVSCFLFIGVENTLNKYMKSKKNLVSTIGLLVHSQNIFALFIKVIRNQIYFCFQWTIQLRLIANTNPLNIKLSNIQNFIFQFMNNIIKISTTLIICKFHKNIKYYIHHARNQRRQLVITLPDLDG